MGIYNGVWQHLYKQAHSYFTSSSDRKGLIPSYDEKDAYASSPSTSSAPYRRGADTTSDQDSINV